MGLALLVVLLRLLSLGVWGDEHRGLLECPPDSTPLSKSVTTKGVFIIENPRIKSLSHCLLS